MKKFRKLLLILGGMVMLFGCMKRSYRIDFGGNENAFSGVKSSYKEGTQVTLKYDLVATDTSYSFTLDGEPLNYTCEDGVFVIRFIMPDHDVKLECSTMQTMAMKVPVIEVRNELKAADIWILEDNETNRRKSLWGTADISGQDNGGELHLSSGKGIFLFRMIDEDHMYYAADGLELDDGDTLVIKGEENRMDASLIVYDAEGNLKAEYELEVNHL